MPVHPVEGGGFRWGSSGKVYPTREEAERQAAAIYASGWREDSPRGRRARRELHLSMSPSKRSEAAYTRELVSVLRGVHRGVMSLVDHMLVEQKHARHDAVTFPHTEWRTLGDRIAKHLRPRVGTAFDRMAKNVDQKSARSMSLIGIRPNAPGVQAAIAHAREDNIRLIEKAGREYADDVRDVLTDPENVGLRAEALRDLLAERASVSLSHAALIATDQTLKLCSRVNQARQRASGISRYQWSTSKDEKVRPKHLDLEGQVFDWDDPPETNDDGDRNHPGEDYRCRCVPIPVTADMEVEPEEASETEAPDYEQAAE